VTVVCLLERDGSGFAEASLRALSFASSCAARAGAVLTAVVFEAGDGTLAEGAGTELAVRDVAQLCVVPSAVLAAYAPAAWARALHQLMLSDSAVAVIAAATDRGTETLAHLGAISGLPMAANCVSAVPADEGTWQLTRQRWAGSLLEDAILEAPCALLTVLADAGLADAGLADAGSADAGSADAGAAGAAVPDLGQGPAVRVLSPDFEEADLLVVASESAESVGGMSLATARVVVGGGRGVGGPDGFAVLEELAGLLGGVVGVSRVVTSEGWRPHRQQVGQTGTKISPELYLACGISGAIQHMAGCLSAKHIVVVNTDPDAPIISRAEYAVIGDLSEVIPALVAAIRAGPAV
jgi:electron transfer flavoprotein alpha subunit